METNHRRHSSDVCDAILRGHFSVAGLRDFAGGFADDSCQHAKFPSGFSYPDCSGSQVKDEGNSLDR